MFTLCYFLNTAITYYSNQKINMQVAQMDSKLLSKLAEIRKIAVAL
jgi:hypothetical protein